MTYIDFRTKISTKRPHSSSKDLLTSEYNIMRTFESDRGRIINSAAIRRLQQKTQVFPLERNAAVRSRLTHSLEVQQTGRYTAKEILEALKKFPGGLETFGLQKLTSAFESLVEMACLIHDVGNPPFGHFGEAAINDWFSVYLKRPLWNSFLEDEKNIPDQAKEIMSLDKKMRQDLCHFEGNAQAIRLVHTLLQLNLTYAQVACILKYTAPAWWDGERPEKYNYLMKKPGYYLSEEKYIETLRCELNIKEYHRFPLTYIMEAADDISYCIADLDDAVEKDIFDIKQLHALLLTHWGNSKPGDLFSTVVTMAFNEAMKQANRQSPNDVFFRYLRVNIQKVMVKFACSRFIAHLPEIYSGEFNGALLEDQESEEYRLLKTFKSVAVNNVFNDAEVEQIELQGYRVIRGLLEIYQPLMDMSSRDFTLLMDTGTNKTHPIATRLFHKLPLKHCRAYRNKMLEMKGKRPVEFSLWEKYYRIRLIQDYISGMTDLYAWDEYRRLMAIDTGWS